MQTIRASHRHAHRRFQTAKYVLGSTRTLATASTQQPHVVILGGGITGLSAAYHLSRRSKDTRVTVLESSTRLGGWVNSEHVRVGSPGDSASNVVLESGPRTLRPNSKAVLELINLLGLESELITVPNTSPAARNRFLYIPGTRKGGLTTLPTPASLASFWTSPVGSTLVSAVLDEFWVPPNRSSPVDESVDAFLSRRFGSEIARKFASAMTHGIYAADSRRLSVRAAFPSLWDAESRGNGSVAWGLLKSPSGSRQDDYETGTNLRQLMEQVSVYSFKRGMSTLTSALTAELAKSPNVEFRIGEGATTIEVGNDFMVHTNSGTLKPTHIISAIPTKKLVNVLAEPSIPLKSILSTHLTTSSSVYVTNLVFPPTTKPIHPAGFGYLIPRPAEGYSSEENQQGMLGVIFDSVSLSEQDSAKGYTKMTVISGGPYPSTGPPNVNAMLEDIRLHLGSEYEVPSPVRAVVTHCPDCIPLYEVGHLERVDKLKEVLQPFGNRLQVIGASVGGISVPDCIEQGRQAARTIIGT